MTQQFCVQCITFRPKLHRRETLTPRNSLLSSLIFVPFSLSLLFILSLSLSNFLAILLFFYLILCKVRRNPNSNISLFINCQVSVKSIITLIKSFVKKCVLILINKDSLFLYNKEKFLIPLWGRVVSLSIELYPKEYSIILY